MAVWRDWDGEFRLKQPNGSPGGGHKRPPVDRGSHWFALWVFDNDRQLWPDSKPITLGGGSARQLLVEQRSGQDFAGGSSGHEPAFLRQLDGALGLRCGLTKNIPAIWAFPGHGNYNGRTARLPGRPAGHHRYRSDASSHLPNICSIKRLYHNFS